jgi:hypothetical protein
LLADVAKFWSIPNKTPAYSSQTTALSISLQKAKNILEVHKAKAAQILKLK